MSPVCVRTIALRLSRLFDPPKHGAGELSDRAVSTLRSLIEKIVLVPDPDPRGLLIDLYGDPAGIAAPNSVSSALLDGATMTQKSSSTQSTQFGPMALTGDNGCHITLSLSAGWSWRLSPSPYFVQYSCSPHHAYRLWIIWKSGFKNNQICRTDTSTCGDCLLSGSLSGTTTGPGH